MKGEVELQVGDLHAGVVMVTEADPVGFGTMDINEDTMAVHEREIWLRSDQEDLLGVNDASMFYADFPPLPDFPCMSSSSSSSSTTAPPAKTITCSSSSSSTSSASSSSEPSWAVLKSDVEEDVEKKNHHYFNQYDPVGAALSCTTTSMEISQPTDPASHCMDVMETFGYMDLIESNDFFDPASIFQNEENPLEEFPPQQEEHAVVVAQQQPPPQQQEAEEGEVIVCAAATTITNNNNNNEEEVQGEGVPDGEMSTVFLEWLKSNKDSVSANDLRSVKLKKATIECAARRLGGGKEAMKQLLKLILEWVQTSHLQNKRRKENNSTPSNLVSQFQDPSQNLNTNPSSNNNLNPSSFGPDHQSNTCFMNQSPSWIISPPPFGADPGALATAAPPFPQPMFGYMGGVDPYKNGASNNINGTHTHNTTYPAAATEYHVLESAHSWPPSQFTVSYHYNQSFGDHNLPPAGPPPPPPPAFAGYGNQYPYQFFHGPGDRLMRLGPSATKEARKKRMARQRRSLSHHRHHNHHVQQNQHHQINQTADPHARLGGDNCTALVAAHANPANWVYWQAVAGGGTAPVAPVIPAEPPAGQQVVDRTAMQTQNYHQGRVSSDRRQGPGKGSLGATVKLSPSDQEVTGSSRENSLLQKCKGWKPEKNLRFLLQKVLKQSDVGSLGRIVLPKKEAETHLPELEARDGISIAMEDIGTSRVWNMRYRYWPNNKSRMYLLENTGDFVRANRLQEGDFIVIYSDVKCGKFMIRGVKVRQQGAKPETKKAGKSQKNQHWNNAATTAGTDANNGTPSSSTSPQQKTEKAAK